MFNDDRICLLSSCCFVCNSVQWPFHTVDCHSCFVSLVDADPSEPYQLQLFLKIHINRKSLPDFVMDQRNPQL